MTTTPDHPPPPTGSPDPCTMLARCPDDLLAMAPVLLGYWPREAVVMLTFGADHPFHAGLPLPPAAEQAADVRQAAVEMLMDPVRRLGVRQVVLLYHSGDPAAVTQLDADLRRALRRQGVAVVEAIHADGAQWRDLRHPDEPAVPYDVTAHPFVVQAIVSGRLTHGSRDDLVRSFDADEAEVARTLAALDASGHHQPPVPIVAVVRNEGEWVHERVSTALRDEQPLSPDDLARLVWAMQAARVRDAAWALIDRRTAGQHLRLWSDVVRRAPAGLVAAPAVLLGWSAWQTGNGAVARIAVDRCLEAAPDDRLGSCLESILDHAVPPDAWRGGFDWAEGLP